MPLATTTRGRLNIFPEISTRSIEINQKNGRLKIGAHIIVKEHVKNRATWYTRPDRAVNLYFKVVLSTSPNALEMYRKEPTFVTEKQLKTVNTKESQEVMINVGQYLLDNGDKFDMKSLNKYLYKIDRGIKFYQIPIYVEFELNNSPQHLELLLIPKSLSGVAGMAEARGDNNFIKRDIILQDGATPPTNTALVSNGVLWTGPTYQIGDRVAAGAYHNKKAKPSIEIQNIPNTKIKDFRIKDRIAEVSFAPREKNKLQQHLEQKDAGFSQMFKTKNVFDLPTFAFSINFNTLLRRHIELDVLCGDVRRDLKEFVSFKTLKVLRRRIELDNDKIVPTSAHPEVVGVIDRLEAAVKGAGSANKNISVLPNLISRNVVNNEITHFQFADQLMEVADHSLYQYGIEIVFEDKSAANLNSVRRALDVSTTNLKRWAKQAELSFNANTGVYAQSFRNKNRDNIQVRNAIGSLSRAMTFSLNRPDYILAATFLMNIASVDTGSPDGINMLISLMERTSNKIGQKTSPYKKPLTQATGKTDSTGTKNFTREKVTYFFDDYYDASPNKYAYDFLAIVGDKGQTPTRIDQDVSYTPMRTLSATQYTGRTVAEMDKYFKMSLATQPDRFSKDLTDNNGNVLNPGDSLASTQFTYLTPSGVKMSGVNVTQLRSLKGNMPVQTEIVRDLNERYFDNLLYDVGEIEHSKFNDLLAELSTIKSLGKNHEISLKGDANQKITESMERAFKSRSISFKRGPTASSKSRNASRGTFTTHSQKSTTQKGVGLIKNDLESKKVKPNNMYLFSLLGDTQLSSIKDSIKMFDLNSEESPVNKDSFGESSKQSKINKIKQLPNQIKSLMMNRISGIITKKPLFGSSDDPVRDPKNLGFFYMYYRNIVLVEYLATYELSQNGSPNPKQPVWRPLTQAVLSENTTTNLLCRMTRYEAPEFGIRKTDLLEFPIYDEYFRISKDLTETAAIPRSGPTETAAALQQVNQALMDLSNVFIMGSGDYISPEDTFSLNLVEAEG